LKDQVILVDIAVLLFSIGLFKENIVPVYDFVK